MSHYVHPSLVALELYTQLIDVTTRRSDQAYVKAEFVKLPEASKIMMPVDL